MGKNGKMYKHGLYGGGASPQPFDTKRESEERRGWLKLSKDILQTIKEG